MYKSHKPFLYAQPWQ